METLVESKSIWLRNDGRGVGLKKKKLFCSSMLTVYGHLPFVEEKQKGPLLETRKIFNSEKKGEMSNAQNFWRRFMCGD